MDQQNEHSNGAPSTDTTSALFVSARKKQLEQQEAERQAREREAERLAAEAEVRRLEQEVAERKRLAQEEAQRVEREAALRRQQAQQEAQRAEQEAHKKSQTAAYAAQASPKANADIRAKLGGLKPKTLMFIGGGVAALIVAVILIVTLSTGGKSVSAKNFKGQLSSKNGLTLSYPDTWSASMLAGDGNGLYLEGDDGMTVLAVADSTMELEAAVSGGKDAVSAAEDTLYTIAGVFADGNTVTDMTPELVKSGDSVTGSASFRYQKSSLAMQGVVKIEHVEGARTIFMAYAIPEDKKADKQQKLCEAILSTLVVGDAPETAGAQGSAQTTGSDASETTAYWETDSRFVLYSNQDIGLKCYIPAEMEGKGNVNDVGPDAPSGVSFQDKLFLLNFTSSYQSTVRKGGGTLQELAQVFVNYFAEENGGAQMSGLSIGAPAEEDAGVTRVNFSFRIESYEVICVLRANKAEGTCIVAMGVDISDAQREYFEVMVSSASASVG